MSASEKEIESYIEECTLQLEHFGFEDIAEEAMKELAALREKAALVGPLAKALTEARACIGNLRDTYHDDRNPMRADDMARIAQDGWNKANDALVLANARAVLGDTTEVDDGE